MKRFILFGAIACLSLSLSACASNGGLGNLFGPSKTTMASGGDDLSDLVTFTKADLDAAEANAIATNNQVVIPCPPALEKWIDSTVGQVGQLQVKGLFSGAVAGEAVVNGVQAGIPDYVYTGCGPAYMKLHADLYKVIGKGALIGAGG